MGHRARWAAISDMRVRRSRHHHGRGASLTGTAIVERSRPSPGQCGPRGDPQAVSPGVIGTAAPATPALLISLEATRRKIGPPADRLNAQWCGGLPGVECARNHPSVMIAGRRTADRAEHGSSTGVRLRVPVQRCPIEPDGRPRSPLRGRHARWIGVLPIALSLRHFGRDGTPRECTGTGCYSSPRRGGGPARHGPLR